MKQSKSTLQENFKGLQVLWISLIMGIVMMTVLFFSMVYESPNFYDYNTFLKNPLMGIAAFLTAVSVFVPSLVIKKKIESTNLQGLVEKVADFRSSFIVKAALHEGPALITILFMFLENNFYFLILGLINLFLLYLSRPTVEKFKQWYSLTNEENQELKSANLTL